MCVTATTIPSINFDLKTLNGELLQLFQALDKTFLGLSRQVNAKEYQFSSFISARDLKKMDYLHSFPQHVTFPAVLDAEEDNLKAFQKNTIIDSRDEIQITRLAPVKDILTPAACYHFYIYLQQHDFEQAQFLTTRNTCFRNEKQFIPLERQWSFSMREIVCIGSESDIKNFLTLMQDKVDALLQLLGINSSWETASDPFFDPSNNPKHWMQCLQPNKQEMVFNDRLAIGSLNNHRNYFGESFGITINGEYAHSACLAFGLERWVAAVLEQFGPDHHDWPLQIPSMPS